jgi:hypothetical protein
MYAEFYTPTQTNKHADIHVCNVSFFFTFKNYFNAYIMLILITAVIIL